MKNKIGDTPVYLEYATRYSRDPQTIKRLIREFDKLLADPQRQANIKKAKSFLKKYTG